MTIPHTTKSQTPAKEAEEFEVLLISDDVEPGYAVLFPALPGCFSQGEDRDDALAMAVDAIQCHLAPPYNRRTVSPDRKERLIAEYTADGCRVEVTTVQVIV